MVKVELPVPPLVSVTGFRLNELLVLLGRPLTLRLTVPANPLIEVRLTA